MKMKPSHISVAMGFNPRAPLVDIVKVGFVGHPCELASRIVSPAVKAANESALAKSLLVVDQPIAAMYADVMERPYLPVLAPNQQDGGVGNREIAHHVTAGLRNVFLPAQLSQVLRKMRSRSSSNSSGDVQVSVGTGPVPRSGCSFIQRRWPSLFSYVEPLRNRRSRGLRIPCTDMKQNAQYDPIIFESVKLARFGHG